MDYYGMLIIKLLFLPGILIGLAFHEFAHALAADRLGDPTPRQQGRLTIEPWPHIDLFGFISLLLIGFGWAKPVQIDPRNFKKPKRDDNIVSVAGPLANLILAVIFALVILVINNFNIIQGLPQKAVYYFFVILYGAVWINVLLFVFNLLPIPPLDGSHIVANLLPYEQANKYMSLQMYSLLIFIVIAFTGAFQFLILPPVKLVYSMILTLLGLPDLLYIL